MEVATLFMYVSAISPQEHTCTSLALYIGVLIVIIRNINIIDTVIHAICTVINFQPMHTPDCAGNFSFVGFMWVLVLLLRSVCFVGSLSLSLSLSPYLSLFSVQDILFLPHFFMPTSH